MNNSTIRSIGFRFVWCLTVVVALFQINVSAGGSRVVAAKLARAESRAQFSLWQPVAEEDLAARGQRRIVPEKYLIYRLHQNALNRLLADAPLEFSDAARGEEIVLELPTPDGAFERFRIEETPLLSTELAAQFPGWKTFQGYGIDDPTATARFDVTLEGFHGYVLSSRGTYAIDPLQTNDRENYIVYAKADIDKNAPMHCDVDTTKNRGAAAEEPAPDAPSFSNGAQIRTYRLAVAATAEYTSFFRLAGDTDAQAQTRALAAIVVSVNRVAGLYRRDLAVNFNLISGTNLIYTDANTDPYTNDDGSVMLGENQENVDAVIGPDGYDIGHVFSTGGGGVAYLGSVCSTGGIKAGGVTGQSQPVGDPFDIDYVAHEMGHQFNQNHTFNAAPDCGSSPLASRVEAGSGVTIMGYAGICSSNANLARNSIDVFHVYNLTETVNFITGGGGATCGTLSGSNAPPVIAALTNYTIPYNTPFTLTASATDANGNPLTYNWEQNNNGTVASNYPTVTDDDDTNLGVRPLFRSYAPTTSPTRNFPSLPYILSNSNEAPVLFTGTSPLGAVCAGTCITGEDLPSIARVMNFRVSVRDNQGGTTDAGMTVTSVVTTTPFRLTTQNAAIGYAGGSTQTVSWNVSGTSGAPINAVNVRISLSTNGGQTFPTILAASTANDGSESIIIPNTPTAQARIKIEAVGNVFFDINDVNFNITSAPTASAATVGGRVATAAGRGISRATVTMIDADGAARSVLTNSFGYYRFADVPAGETYTFTVRAKRYSFNQSVRVLSISEDTEAIDFIGESNE